VRGGDGGEERVDLMVSAAGCFSYQIRFVQPSERQVGILVKSVTIVAVDRLPKKH